MSNIDKQWLQQKIAEREAARDDIQFGLDEDDSNTLAALRIALASLEAGPVYFVEIEDGQDINAGRIEGKNRPDLSLLPDGINHLYAAPPAPVSVPEEVSWEDVPEEITEDDMALASAWAHGFNQCRAAMLQGAEPVTTAYKLPANTPCKDAPEHIWLQTAGVWPENGEFSELTWCSDNQHPDDTLYVRADVVAGNSPVIPDDVRRMDWLVSKTVDVREPMVYGSHSLFWSQTITDEEDDYHATKLREQIDAAMVAEQAAAPQQEVK